jgi:hypothetical protein
MIPCCVIFGGKKEKLMLAVHHPHGEMVVVVGGWLVRSPFFSYDRQSREE